jgi:mRNA interferase MazF
MQKDFDNWNNQKKKNHNEKVRPFFHEREIWFCNLGVNIGFEQDGSGENFMRPVIVIKKFANEVCWVIPLTRTEKKGKYYYNFSFEKGVVSNAIISQIRLIDSKRLFYKVGDMEEVNFREMIERIKKLFP